MSERRQGASLLKGRLADVFVPALVSGDLEALSRRLGNRATIDDPVHGRGSSLASVDPLLAKIAASLAEASAVYRHVTSTTGVERDVAEGVLTMTYGSAKHDVPIVVVAERRRMREIELRLTYAPPEVGSAPSSRTARMAPGTPSPSFRPPPVVGAILRGLREGAVDEALAGFEDAGRAVDVRGRAHARRDGALAALLSDLKDLELTIGGGADDGRTCCLEATAARRDRAPCPAVLSFERGDSGLVRELRLYVVT